MMGPEVVFYSLAILLVLILASVQIGIALGVASVIGVYLAHQMSLGRTFREALKSSLNDFDGSFSYLAASGNELAYAKDRFGFKPLLVAESEDWVAIATEEIALRSTLTGNFDALEPGVNQIRIWSLPQPDAETV